MRTAVRGVARTILALALLWASPVGLAALVHCEACTISAQVTGHRASAHPTSAHLLSATGSSFDGSCPSLTLRCPMPCCSSVGGHSDRRVAATLNEAQALSGPSQDDGAGSLPGGVAGVEPESGSSTLAHPARGPARSRGALYLLDSSFRL